MRKNKSKLQLINVKIESRTTLQTLQYGKELFFEELNMYIVSFKEFLFEELWN